MAISVKCRYFFDQVILRLELDQSCTTFSIDDEFVLPYVNHTFWRTIELEIVLHLSSSKTVSHVACVEKNIVLDTL